MVSFWVGFLIAAILALIYTLINVFSKKDRTLDDFDSSTEQVLSCQLPSVDLALLKSVSHTKKSGVVNIVCGDVVKVPYKTENYKLTIDLKNT